MIKQLEDLMKDIGSKPTWSAKELLPKIQSTSSQLQTQLEDAGKIINVSAGGKKTKVQTLKKYDILYAPLIGIPHYFMVHKIIDQAVYGIIFTSSNKPAFCVHEVKADRILEGSHATNTYLSMDLTQAMDCFVRVYESKTEADLIFKKVADHYRSIFK